MSLLWMDGFDDGFALNQKYVLNGAPTVGTARNGSGFVSTSDQAAVVRALGANKSTIIVGCAVATNSINNWYLHDWGIIAGFVGTSGQWTIRVNTSTFLLEARRGGSSGTLLATGTHVLPADGTFNYIEVKVVCSTTSGGSIEVRLNGAVEFTFSGQTCGSYSYVDTIRLQGQVKIDDVYILDTAGSTCNDFLGDCKVETLRPSGNGTYAQGVGSDSNSTDNYALVDETTPSSTDYVGLTTAGHKDSYAYGDLASVSGTVHAVQTMMYGAKSDAGAATMRSLARLSGGSEATGATQSPSTSYMPIYDIMETKPGGGAWTVSDVNGAEFGVERVA